METTSGTVQYQTSAAASRNWHLTQEAFDAFLAKLDPDRDRAGDAYQQLRNSLVRFLSASGNYADEWADEAIDRTIRKNCDEDIQDIQAFAFGVAKRMRIEKRRNSNREVALENEATLPAAAAPSPEDRIDTAARMACLEDCCARLTTDERELLVSWYAHSGSERIAHRKHLASQWGIAASTLRVRAFRTREMLRGVVARHGFHAVMANC